MGYSRKEEIAKLRRERKEAKAAKKRKENIREKLVRFLIVCEGTKTEPHYFEALINNCISAVREVTIEGEGRATVALVDRTQEIKVELERKNAMTFDRVWVVFDKDDFEDFNEAIKCTLNTLIQASAALPILRNSKKFLETEWVTKPLSIGKATLIYTAYSSSMAARIWLSALPSSYVHYTLASTMQPISLARWLTS